MPKLILHVGTGKTGTTSIQVALKRNEVALAERGFHVVEARRTLPQLAKHKLNWRDPKDQGWAEFAAEAERVRPTGRHLIMSNEGLWRVSPDDLKHLAEVFSGYEPMVVMYVREQAEWIQSSLLQKQKRKRKRFDLHNQKKVDRWIRRRPLDYLTVCQGMERALGAGCVHARIFNRSAFVDGDLLVDFFQAIGVSDPHQLDLAQVESNPSLAAQFADILVRAQRGDDGTRLHNKQMQDLACRLTANGVGSRFFLSRERVEALREDLRPHNEQFFRDYLKNGTALPVKAAWVTGEEESVESIEAKMNEITRRLALLGASGWSGQSRMAAKVFPQGWQLVKADDGDTSTAVLTAETGVVTFRLPFRRRFRHKHGVQVRLALASGSPAVARVTVNGTDLGELNLAQDLITFPVALCEPLDEVRIELTPTGPAASPLTVLRFEVPSLGVDDDDALDLEAGDDDEDEDDEES